MNDPKGQKTAAPAALLGQRTCISFFALVGALLFSPCGLAADLPAPIKIVAVGDSTVCDYPQNSPNRGWGQFVSEWFKDGSVNFVNLAAGGRSTKTFIAEGRWRKALDEKPAYIFIQFGHNDSHPSNQPEATDAATTYRDNLRHYVDDSRAIGAIPILVTPMVRRNFDAAGKIVEPAPPASGNLLPYVTVMKEVAAEKAVPVIDLYTASKNLAERLGPSASAALANKKGDTTHFNEKGAKAMGELVLRELPTQVPALKTLLKTP